MDTDVAVAVAASRETTRSKALHRSKEGDMIHHKIIFAFTLLNTTLMTWHEGHLSLIASNKC
jgi:hypothetical protein